MNIPPLFQVMQNAPKTLGAASPSQPLYLLPPLETGTSECMWSIINTYKTVFPRYQPTRCTRYKRPASK